MTLLATLPVVPAIRSILIVPALVTRVRGFWRRIEPGLQIDRDNLIERWDCTGEGRATCVSFEGFGITLSLFIGLTPRFMPHEVNDRTDQLIQWYAGEAQA